MTRFSAPFLLVGLLLLASGSARADGSRGTRGPGIFLLHPTASLGLQRGRVDLTSTPFGGAEPGPPRGPDSVARTLHAGGEFRLVLGARLGAHVALGAFTSIIPGAEPEPFISGSRKRANIVGGELALTQGPNRGLFLSLRGGAAWVDGQRGPALSVAAGYLWPVADFLSLSFGAECTRLSYSRHEDGDYGKYDYDMIMWMPAFTVGARLLSPR